MFVGSFFVRVINVPDKQPGFWVEIMSWFNDNAVAISAAALSFAVAVARSTRDGVNAFHSLPQPTNEMHSLRLV